MDTTAQLVLNSYDSSKIKTAISKIKKSNSKFNVKLGKPITSKTKLAKGEPKIWGCETNDLKREVMEVSGSVDDLKKLLLNLKLTEGVYIQLLPRE